MEEWQAKHPGPDMPTRLTTGFLDGTHPVVDIYELKAGLLPVPPFLACVHLSVAQTTCTCETAASTYQGMRG